MVGKYVKSVKSRIAASSPHPDADRSDKTPGGAFLAGLR